ncbi:MAG: type II toxin-antitoxin system HicB family antitoxin [Longimicrobiales bacterium]
MRNEKKDLSYYKGQPYSRRIRLIQEEDGEEYFVASIAELPGVEADGSTPWEAAYHLQSAFEEYLQAMLEWGDEIPEPEIETFPRERTIWERTVSREETEVSSSEDLFFLGDTPSEPTTVQKLQTA